MRVGNYDLMYFDDHKECFRTYEVIIDSLKVWEFPFQVNDGYAIYYDDRLDKILDIEKYDIRRVMNIKNTMLHR